METLTYKIVLIILVVLLIMILIGDAINRPTAINVIGDIILILLLSLLTFNKSINLNYGNKNYGIRRPY